MLIEQEISGYLCLASDKIFAENIINTLTSVADMAANASKSATMHGENDNKTIGAYYAPQNHRQCDHIQHRPDVCFLNIVIEQVKDKLRVDAAAILLFDPITNFLEYAASIGFLHKAINKIRLGYGESYAGRGC